ncbi:MAG: polymer-forming cytoskeletal protein [Planctomycetota bacterium]
MSSANQRATALGEGARVEGDLYLNHHATVAGEVTGDVRCDGTVELTATAHVHGDVHAAAVRVAGRVDGGVTAGDQAELLPGVRISGGLVTARLSVAEGVSYDGALRLTGGQASAKAGTAVPRLSIKRNRATAEEPGPSAGLSGDPSFAGVPGATNAGLRPRRRAPLPSVI